MLNKVLAISLLLCMPNLLSAATTKNVCTSDLITAEITTDDTNKIYLNFKSKSASISFPADIQPTVITNSNGTTYQYIAPNGNAAALLFGKDNSCTMVLKSGGFYVTNVGTATTAKSTP